MKENCIISFANTKNNYVKSLERLNESLRSNFDGDFISWIGEGALGAPLHVDNPYAFKIYAFRKAKDLGYKNVLWLDSSVYAIKNVQPVFDEIKRDGFIFQEAGHFVGNWSSDSVLKYYGITRDEAMEMRMIGNAGFLGLNFEMGRPIAFLDKWSKAMENGLFKGAWNNNDKSLSEDERCFGMRHDMTNSSIIINQMGLYPLAKSAEEWLQYATPFQATMNDTIVFKAWGL